MLTKLFSQTSSMYMIINSEQTLHFITCQLNIFNRIYLQTCIQVAIKYKMEKQNIYQILNSTGVSLLHSLSTVSTTAIIATYQIQMFVSCRLQHKVWL